jgi:hypothetical protein
MTYSSSELATGALPLFREEQQFRSRWLWFVLLASFGATLILFLWICYSQLILGQMLGDRPLLDWALVFTTVAIAIILSLNTYLVWIMCLVVEVYPTHIQLDFFPLSQRLIPSSHRIIPFSEIREFEQRTYKPLREYGGWGIRRGWRDRAYTVSGNQGVQITFHTGQSLLIGSQRATELAAVIREQLAVIR